MSFTLISLLVSRFGVPKYRAVRDKFYVCNNLFYNNFIVGILLPLKLLSLFTIADILSVGTKFSFSETKGPFLFALGDTYSIHYLDAV